MKTMRRIYSIPYVMWLLLFVIAPVLMIIYQSFFDMNGQFTLANYQTYFTSGTYLSMTINSVWYAFLITIFTLLVSYPTAYFLTKLKHKQLWLMLVILPTWVNLLLKAYAFIGIFSIHGSINQFMSFMGLGTHQILFTDFSFLFVATYIEIPFMIMPIFNALEEMNPSLISASRDLGASSAETFRRVIFPLSLNGVKSGVQAVFIPSLSLFMLTRLIGGNRVITLGTAIEEHFLVTQNWGMGSTIGVILIVAMFIVFALLYAPIFYLIFYSFNDTQTMNQFTGFTLDNYRNVFEDTRLLTIVLNTFLLAFLSALIATIIGTFGAMGIYYTKRRKNRNTLLSFNNILLVSPDVIIGASFLIFFTAVGFISLGFTSVLLSHIAFSIPIVVLMVLPKLQEMNDSMVDAARDLGANNVQVIKNIILPFLAPGIIAGYFMAFTYSLDDFAVTFFVTGNGFSTLSVEIYSRARQGISLEINALSALVFLFSMILVVGYYFISKDNTPKRLKKMRREQSEVAKLK